MLKVVYDWHDLLYSANTGAKSSGQLYKAMNKIASRRAYNCTYTHEDHMFVKWRVDRSNTKAAFTVLLVFDSVGREHTAGMRLIAAKCHGCVAGDNHGGCSHTLSSLTGLAMLQMDLIVAGDRCWRRHQLGLVSTKHPLCLCSR